MKKIVRLTRYPDFNETRRDLSEKEEKFYVFTDFEGMMFWLEQKLELRYETDNHYSKVDGYGLTIAEIITPETP